MLLNPIHIVVNITCLKTNTSGRPNCQSQSRKQRSQHHRNISATNYDTGIPYGSSNSSLLKERMKASHSIENTASGSWTVRHH